MHLQSISSDELKKMSKKEVHEGYKKIICHMLMTFYLDVQEVSDSLENWKDLGTYIENWVEENTQDPSESWNPGDMGK